MIRQVHGSRVLRVEEDPADAAVGTERALELQEADGQATARPGVAPIVLTADCLPIAIAGGGAVAMLHAGWRGLADGVVDEGVRAVRELARAGAARARRSGRARAAAATRSGEEVHAQFASYGGGRAPRPQARPEGDRARAARARRRRGRPRRRAVHDLLSGELFFSHRRDSGVTGRQAGVAWLT